MLGKFKKSLVVGGLLAIFFIQAVASMSQKTPTADEAAHHIGVGYSFLKTGDFRLNSTGPPLMEELAAFPLLFLKDLKVSFDHPSWTTKIERVDFCKKFLYEDNLDKLGKIIFLARIPIVLTGVFLGFLIYLWSSKLYGFESGAFALFLYAFSPSVLGLTRLVTMDMGACCFIFLAVFCFYLYCRNPSLRNLIFSGIAFGLAQLSKYTSIYLYPLFFVFILVIWLFRKKDFMEEYKVGKNIKKFIVNVLFVFLIGNFVVFAGYFFEIKPLLLNDVDVEEKITYFDSAITKVFGNDSEWLKDKFNNFALHQPIPFSTYIMGFLGASNQTFVEHKFNPILFGQRSDGGWWYYYFGVFLLKTSLSVLIILIISVLYGRFLKREKTSELFLAIPVVMFMVFTTFSVLQLGLRYILPIYPFLFVYISKVANINVTGKKWFTQRKLVYILVLILGFYHLYSSLRVFPHYLSFFNALAGGPNNGYKYLTRVNASLGQNLKGLADFLEVNNISRVKLSYWGFAPPEIYNINCLQIKDIERKVPEKEVYAISVHYIDEFEWTKKFKPRCKIGYSIFIYDFRYW